MGKDSFILYDSYAEQIEFLTDEQAGVLLKAIYAYRNGNSLPTMESAVGIIFSFIRSQLEREQEKYDNICERNKQNIGKRWNTKNTSGIPGIPKNTSGIPKNTKNTDNDYDYDYENDIKEKDNNKLLSKKKGFIPPTFDDVQAYAEQRGREDLAKPFFDFFTAGDWCDSNGTPVKSWKQKFITWETHNEKKEPPPTSSPYRKKVEYWQGD